MISSVDTTSPFFSSLAGQSEVQNEKLKAERAERKQVSEQKKTFQSVLQESAPNTFILPEKIRGKSKEDAVQILMADIEAAGDALSKKPLPANMQTYRQAVQSFIHFIVSNSYTVMAVEAGTVRRKKIQTTVQVVDKALDRLASDILSNQQGRFKILERLGEIRGLLVDIAT